MKVAIYTRVSTNDQSTAMQVRELRAYCERRGWAIAQEYADEGISGTKASRPALDRLMRDARHRKWDCCLVWAFDRFARSTKHLLLALEEFKGLGIQFVSYQQNIDTAGPFGEFFFTIVAAFGQLERSMIVERVKSGMAAARARGVRLGRKPSPPPFDVEKARAMLAAGQSMAAVGTALGVSAATICRRMASA